MRTIEFRGYSLSDKKWKYGYYYVNTLGMHNIVCPDGHTWEVDPNSVWQYTWILDKNSKKIYDWDIVIDPDKTHYGYNKPQLVIIWKYRTDTSLQNIWYWAWEWFQVIGNNYQNPNFLQQ